MTKQHRKLIQGLAVTAADLFEHSHNDVNSQKLCTHYLRECVDAGKFVSEGFVAEVNGHWNLIRRILETEYKYRLVLVRDTYFKRIARSKPKPLMDITDAHQFLCIGGGVIAAGVHRVVDPELDYLWLASLRQDSNVLAGKRQKVVDRGEIGKAAALKVMSDAMRKYPLANRQFGEQLTGMLLQSADQLTLDDEGLKYDS